MSMVAGPSLEILANNLELAKQKNYLPFAEVLSRWVDQSEISARYNALTSWYSERKHFWVGDGPFYLHGVYPVERVVVLRRFQDFPDPSDKWLNFTQAEIPELTLEGPIMVELGSDAEFNLRITFGGEPYEQSGIDDVRYLLFDGDGVLRDKGEVKQSSSDQWTITLNSDLVALLGSGANSLEISVTSNRVALPAFASHAFATVPRGTQILEESE